MYGASADDGRKKRISYLNDTHRQIKAFGHRLLRQERRVVQLGLLDRTNRHVEALYVFPRLKTAENFRISRKTAWLNQGKRLHGLRELYRAVIAADQKVFAI